MYSMITLRYCVAVLFYSSDICTRERPKGALAAMSFSIKTDVSTDDTKSSQHFSGASQRVVGETVSVNTTRPNSSFPTSPVVTKEDKCDVMLCQTDIGRLLVNTTACSMTAMPTINATSSSTIRIMAYQSNKSGKHDIRCQWVILERENHYINLTVERLTEGIIGNFTMTLSEVNDFVDFHSISHTVVDDVRLKNNDVSFSSARSVLVRFESQDPILERVVTLHVDLKEGTYVHDLPVGMLSTNAGYVTSPFFGVHLHYPHNYDGDFTIIIPENKSLVIRFLTFLLQYDSPGCRTDYLQFTELANNKSKKMCTWKCKINVHTFHSSLYIYFHSDGRVSKTGFKMTFAITSRFHEPQQLPSNLFNCSVPHFRSFKFLFSCNTLVECEGGEDEQNCFDHDNDCGKEQAIDAGTKCYRIVFYNQEKMSWWNAHRDCSQRGQKLASFNTFEEYKQFRVRLPPAMNMYCVFIGAQLVERQQAVSTVTLYRYIWQWIDGTTFFQKINDMYRNRGSCSMYYPLSDYLNTVSCHRPNREYAAVCEFHKPGRQMYNTILPDTDSNVTTDPTNALWKVSVIQCPSHHMTRDFLSCDYQADCGAPYAQTSCRVRGVTVPMFMCQRSQSTVHYTLVCDHMQHCPDNSDEDFCKYPDCSPSSFRCSNGQCIDFYMQCDKKLDCYDGSDEVCLSDYKTVLGGMFLSRGSVYLDGMGNFNTEEMYSSDECPPTHFSCPRGLCLPVYLRCNGINDCSGHEDEMKCKTYTCRGFYRCRGSKMCLHAENLCDAVPQCPEQDDEMLCEHDHCPDKCRCQGLAFVCASNFSATSYLALRYLDASGSFMTVSDVRNNIHLITLRLSKCRISSLPVDMAFSNLRELDLSWNELNRVHINHFYSLGNLRSLVLRGNPLVEITNSESPKSVTLSLESVDLSYTNLDLFKGSVFANSPHIQTLNMSWSRLHRIADDGFHVIPKLENLDVRSSRLVNFPRNLLRDLSFLRTVHADYYKLCCEAMLPVSFDPKNCHAPHDLIASCDDLLRSNTYRVFLWIFASLSLVGNVFSVGARLFLQKEGRAMGSFSVFVTNLSVADFFMGLYLSIIGTADIVYRGRYLWSDDEWKTSVACNISGFLCLLSNEVSAFIICLITLDRFLVLRFPFSRFHFGRRTVLAAGGTVWSMGILLAIIPLLPVTSHWEFYSQTGICIPLPFTSSKIFRGFYYSFSVSIVLNLVLFLLIAVGQIIIYMAVGANTMASSTDTRARDTAIARRLITIVVSDFLCWFPIGLLGLLACTGNPIPGELNVAVAIFVLPINSALNPFLYTFNVVMEKRRKAQMEVLLKRLEQERRFQAEEIKNK